MLKCKKKINVVTHTVAVTIPLTFMVFQSRALDYSSKHNLFISITTKLQQIFKLIVLKKKKIILVGSDVLIPLIKL